MPRSPEAYSFTYEDLAELTGLKINTVHQHRTRGGFDPHDLESVIVWLARHGTLELRERMVMNALSYRVLEKPKRKAKKPIKKKAARKKRR